MKKKLNVYNMASIGVMTAIICVIGPLAIPIGPVPISCTNLVIYFALYVLGSKRGAISCIVYIIIGAVGLPVFSSFTGGLSKLVGPTGGYIVGFIFMALIAGFFIDKYTEKWYLCLFGMIVGTAACYMLGSLWLSYEAHISIKSAIYVGVVPFVAEDILKMAVAAFIGPKIRKKLVRANLSFK